MTCHGIMGGISHGQIEDRDAVDVIQKDAKLLRQIPDRNEGAEQAEGKHDVDAGSVRLLDLRYDVEERKCHSHESDRCDGFAYRSLDSHNRETEDPTIQVEGPQHPRLAACYESVDQRGPQGDVFLTAHFEGLLSLSQDRCSARRLRCSV
jgi:hypothetical protein